MGKRESKTFLLLFLLLLIEGGNIIKEFLFSRRMPLEGLSSFGVGGHERRILNEFCGSSGGLKDDPVLSIVGNPVEEYSNVSKNSRAPSRDVVTLWIAERQSQIGFKINAVIVEIVHHKCMASSLFVVGRVGAQRLDGKKLGASVGLGPDEVQRTTLGGMMDTSRITTEDGSKHSGLIGTHDSTGDENTSRETAQAIRSQSQLSALLLRSTIDTISDSVAPAFQDLFFIRYDDFRLGRAQRGVTRCVNERSYSTSNTSLQHVPSTKNIDNLQEIRIIISVSALCKLFMSIWTKSRHPKKMCLLVFCGDFR